MSYKQLIAPMSAALAALIPTVTEATKVPADTLVSQGTAKIGTESVSPVLQRLMYQIGQNTHALTLHKSSSGTLYAQHGTHSSHGSHGSHGSHRSGY